MWNVNISMKKGIKEICIPKTQLTYCQICVNFNIECNLLMAYFQTCHRVA